MTCPICHKRKASRFCPAQSERICSVCCATEREETIDCPSHCEYLIASRHHEGERREFDGSELPFADVKIPHEAIAEHWELIFALTWSISAFASTHRALVDTDVVASLVALAESYRTLASGLYYEKLPDFHLQRELCEALKGAIGSYRKNKAADLGARTINDGTVRDTLIFMAQVAATRLNGRSKGRAYLDFLRSQSKFEAAESVAPRIVVP